MRLIGSASSILRRSTRIFSRSQIASASCVCVTEPKRTTFISIGDVRQQRHLAGPLDGDGDLALMPAAGAGDPARADLALLGDVAPELVVVLVVDLVDLLLAEVARALTAGRRHRRAPASALLLLLSVAPRHGGLEGDVV